MSSYFPVTYLMPGLRYLFGVCITSLHRVWSSKFNRMSILHHCKVKVGEVMEKERKYWFNCLMLYRQTGESWVDICIEHVATFLNIPEIKRQTFNSYVYIDILRNVKSPEFGHETPGFDG